MIASLADVKTYLGISTSTDDAWLQQQIDLVTNAIEGYCERVFSQGSYVQTFYRDQFDRDATLKEMMLYHYPLIGITSIVEKCNSSDPGIPVIDYRFHLPTAKLTKTCGSFFWNGNILEVTFTAGYATIPPVIMGTLCGIVQERYNKKLNGIDVNFGSDVQRISIPGTISIDYDYSLTSNERKTPFGNIVGNYANILDSFRSDRAIVGNVRAEYVS